MSSEEVYAKLRKLMDDHMKGRPIDLLELAFVTGAVHSLRMVHRFVVPEIEYAFLVLNRSCNRRYEECLK